MDKTLLKICGITSEETLTDIAEEKLSIDWLGFVFAYGKRKVTPEQWERLAQRVPDGMKTVGVFVNPDLQEIGEVFQRAPLDLVQLHGQESPAFCQQVKKQFNCQLIKVIGINEEGQANVELEGYQGNVEYLLLDTVTKTRAGGTGKVFAWDRIPSFQNRCKQMGIPLLVAGGLNEGNIPSLIQQYQPYGIDVSSGVESNGKKDLQKMKNIIQIIERMAPCYGN